MHKKWHYINVIQNYSKNVLRLKLILLNGFLPKKWKVRRVPANGTDQQNCLSEKAGQVIPLSISISSCYTAVATLLDIDPCWVFSYLQPDLTATSPAKLGLVTSKPGDSWMLGVQQEALNQGPFSTGTQIAQIPEQNRYLKCWSTLNLTLVLTALQEDRKKQLCCAEQVDEEGFVSSRSRTFTSTQTTQRHEAHCLSTMFPVCKQLHNHDNTGLRVTMN